MAGFKGECRGTFTTAKKIPAKRFQGAACDFQLAKLLGSDLLQGSMTLGIIGDDLLGAAFLLRNLQDETFGTTFTSGIINVHGRLRQR